jgi:hypothetical protein
MPPHPHASAVARIQAAWFFCIEETYAAWQREVESSPQRMRRNWSALIVRSTGIHSKVIYSPTTLPSGATSMFATKVAQHVAVETGLEVGSLAPYLTRSMEVREKEAVEARGDMLVDMEGAPIVHVNEEIALAMHVQRELERAPPQHRPRRHHVRVPTAPGQPVRG